MHSRAMLYTACCASVLTTGSTLDLQAQVRTATRQELVDAPTTPSPGTGNVSVAITTQTGLTGLGNATSVVFSNTAIPPITSSARPPSVIMTPGTVTVTFASNDQLLSNLSRAQACNLGLGSALCRVTLTTIGATGQAIYTLQGVTYTSSGLVVTVAYRQFQFTQAATQTPPPNGTGGNSGGMPGN